MVDLLRPAVPLLRLLPPELAHKVTVQGLAHVPLPPAGRLPERVATTLFGRRIASPVGIAAGFDKDAEAAPALLRLGAGFVEVGTLTPRPQAGNPRPRIFRLPEERAVINRLGFNNRGIEEAAPRLARWAARGELPVGINIGANRDSPAPEADYATGIHALGAHAFYLTANISSPNTPGLRDLQTPERLRRLILACQQARGEAGLAHVPLCIKLAPDLEPGAIPAIADLLLETGVEGLILTNTTVARPEGLQGRHAGEAGGLSGPPLAERSRAVLRAFAERVFGRITLISVGGIETGAELYARIRLGAQAVQLYTGLVWHGAGLLVRLAHELDTLLRADSHARLDDALGADLQARRGGAGP